MVNYAAVHAAILARAVRCGDKPNVYCKSCGLELGSLYACFALHLYEAEPGWAGVTLLRGKGKKGAGGSKIFDIERMGQFFKWAAGAFGFRPAEFFANFYQQCVVLIEKPDILRQIRLE